MSPHTIKLTILRLLSLAQPYALPFETLHTDLNRLLRPELTADEVRVHLRALLDQRMVDFLVEDLDSDNEDARRWLIREAGKAVLKK